MWNEVGDNCFVRRYERFDVNVGVVRGSDGLLVIDTRGDHREAEELLGDLRSLGSGPVRWVANTHWHFDHVFGNGRFVAAAGHRIPNLRTSTRSSNSGVIDGWPRGTTPIGMNSSVTCASRCRRLRLRLMRW